MVKKCSYCGKEIKHNISEKRKWCSANCRNKAQKEKRDNILKDMEYDTTINKAKRGAIGELKVCSHLLELDYDVFRAVSPACPCDLIVMINKKLFRIEVRSNTYSASGKPYPHNKKIRADILAMVLPDKIIYRTFNLNILIPEKKL